MQGGGWTWPQVYRLMAVLMVGAAVLSALVLPRLRAADSMPPHAGTQRPASASSPCWPRWPSASGSATGSARRWPARCSARWSAASSADRRRCSSAGSTCSRCCWASPSRCRWPRGRRAGRVSRRCSAACRATSASAARRAFLLFIVLYKLGDAFAGSLMTPFLLQEHGLHVGRGRRGQQGHRPVADDRRRADRRRADAQARPVALAAAVRRAADGQQPGLLVARGQRQGADAGHWCCRPSTGASSQLAAADAGRRRAADGRSRSRTCPAAWAPRPSSPS